MRLAVGCVSIFDEASSRDSIEIWLADSEQVVDTQQFGELTSSSFGGVALAPGEVRTYELSFEAPKGASRYGLAGEFMVKTLPGIEFVPLAPILVDFAADAGQPPLTQTLAVPCTERVGRRRRRPGDRP